MAKRIIWTKKANIERKELLEYWAKRNGSKTYSIKLNKLIVDTIRQLAQQQDPGRKTEIENVRVKLIKDYLLFFELKSNDFIILTIWDGRRDESSLRFK